MFKSVKDSAGAHHVLNNTGTITEMPKDQALLINAIMKSIFDLEDRIIELEANSSKSYKKIGHKYDELFDTIMSLKVNEHHLHECEDAATVQSGMSNRFTKNKDKLGVKTVSVPSGVMFIRIR